VSSPDVPNFDEVDFFLGDALIEDPYPYFDFLRAQCPVLREPHHDVVMVTGYEEAVTVYNDAAAFSSCNSVTGPFPGFPVPLDGDDVTALIEQHRAELPMSDQIITMDPPVHTDHRALLMRLITPKRLKENEEFIWRLADRQIDEFLGAGECEFVSQFATPFAMLVVADLLGVPEADHPIFRTELARPHGGAVGGTDGESMAHNPLEFLYAKFAEYVEDRRANPRDDVLTGLATATFPDGSLPEVIDVVRIAVNVFAAGQETTVRLLSTSLKLIAEDAVLQRQIRETPALVGNFVEECLRMESPVKGDFRLSKVRTTVGGAEIPAGSTVMVVNGAANRDPRRFDDPGELRIDRANARQHIAFGHGAHTCPGAPLARAEGRISIERLLERMSDIRVAEAHHGPPGARRYHYLPTYILRGMARLHLEFTPAG
jgi:cytochrome P450